jgi:hypothetical protein
MTVFLGTLLITILCCAGLGIGLLLRGRPLTGGCGGKLSGRARCTDCPHRETTSNGDDSQ